MPGLVIAARASIVKRIFLPLTMVILLSRRVETVRTANSKNVATQALLNDQNSPEIHQPAFRCKGGFGPFLQKHITMRRVALADTTIIFIGSCVSQPEFNQAVAHNTRTITPISTISFTSHRLSAASTEAQRGIAEML